MGNGQPILTVGYRSQGNLTKHLLKAQVDDEWAKRECQYISCQHFKTTQKLAFTILVTDPANPNDNHVKTCSQKL